MKLAINASRAKSGGAKNHLISILSNIDPIKYGFTEVHVWTYPELKESIPKRSWLFIHSPPSSNKAIFFQLSWEFFALYVILKIKKFDVLLNVDAGSVCRFNPSITMSRDMVAFEPGEISRLGFSLAALRQVFLKKIQCSSLRSARVPVFLTLYASNVIQDCCGNIKNYKIIPHGASNIFRDHSQKISWPNKAEDPIKIIYVSPISLYKHQWNLIKAIRYLRLKKFKIELLLVGSGEKNALKKLQKEINISDPLNEFVSYINEVKHVEIPKLLSSSHVFAFASSCENMPNTLIEAMCMGLPIACSNKGPMPEILRDAGEYFDPHSTISISKALKKIILDREYRETISSRAIEYSLEFTWERSSNQLFLALSNLANESN